MLETGRIRVAKDKAEFVKTLISTAESTGSFQTYVDVLVFAAALGIKHQKRVALGEISKREPSPIAQEPFIVRGYDTVLNLLAIVETQNLKILSPNEDQIDEKRNHIFEEYANGGLEILQAEFRGAVDYTERILLFLSCERNKQEQDGEFDLSRFLP